MKYLPLHHKHKANGAEFMEIEGWQVVAQHSGVEEELQLVRTNAGLCDGSFWAQYAVEGKDALDFLQKVSVRDLSQLSPGHMIYTSVVDESGKVMDDLTIMCLGENSFYINSLFHSLPWLKEKAAGLSAHVVNVPNAAFTLQGVKSRDILMELVDISDMAHAEVRQVELGGIPVMLARFGFSGELGYELYFHPGDSNDLWDLLMEKGESHGLEPMGVAMAFVISLEKGFLMGPGMDFYEGGTPLEYGLGWSVSYDKDFIGKDAILKRKEEGLKSKLMGFEVLDPSIIAETGSKLIKDGVEVGEVTIGGFGVGVGKSIGRAAVKIEQAVADNVLVLDQDGKTTEVKLAARYKWYDPDNKNIKS